MNVMTSIQETCISTNGAQEAFAADLLRIVLRFAQGAQKIEGLVRLSGGASQETWSFSVLYDHAVERMILRRAPVGAQVVDKIDLDTEAAIVCAVEHAGVPSPHVHYVLTPEDGVGRGFFMTYVEGEALGRKIVRDEKFVGIRSRLAFQAGETLAKIHAIDLGKLPALPTITVAEDVTTLYENYRQWSDRRPVFELAFGWIRERMPPTRNPMRLVHGDFRNGNMLIGPGGIAAVLDWELAHIGDPMRDLGWICTAAWRYSEIDKPVGGFGEREDLVAGYQAAGGAKVEPDVLRFWELMGSIRWGVLCMGMGFRAGQSDRPVEMSMIARRASENEIDIMRLLAPRGAGPRGIGSC